jgi:hypothetical protein
MRSDQPFDEWDRVAAMARFIFNNSIKSDFVSRRVVQLSFLRKPPIVPKRFM